jgi:hypothetical protein
MVYSTFSRSGWSIIRIAQLAKGVTSKKRLSQHLHKAPTRSNKASPRTFQTALELFEYFCHEYFQIICEHGNEPSGSIKKAGCYLTS